MLLRNPQNLPRGQINHPMFFQLFSRSPRSAILTSLWRSRRWRLFWRISWQKCARDTFAPTRMSNPGMTKIGNGKSLKKIRTRMAMSTLVRMSRDFSHTLILIVSSRRVSTTSAKKINYSSESSLGLQSSYEISHTDDEGLFLSRLNLKRWQKNVVIFRFFCR